MQQVRLIDFTAPSKDGKLRLEWSWVHKFLTSDTYSQLTQASGRDILFSLKGFDYLNVDGLIWLLLLGEYLRSRNNSLLLELPEDRGNLQYIKSSNFVNVARDNFYLSNIYALDDIDVSKFPKGLAYFNQISVNSLTSLLSSTGETIRSERFLHALHLVELGRLHAEVFPSFLRIINETTKNVVQHSSEAPNQGVGYFGLQQIGPDRIRICVGDAGQGFRNSLASKGIKVKDDYDGIEQALLFRLHRQLGEGLFRVFQMVSLLQGAIRIRSFSAETFFNLSQRYLSDDEQTRSYINYTLAQMSKRSFPNFPGAQLQIDIRGR